MKRPTREIKYFLFSEYLSDGLRITLGVLLPSLLAAQLGYFKTGLTLSLGALCVSIVDSPGPVQHKRNAMLICLGCIFLVALVSGLVQPYPFLLGAEILAFCFFFSMFAVYGARAAAIGTASLLIMVLMIDQVLLPAEVLGYCGFILAGGLWYLGLSLIFFRVRPYLPVQQALGECIHETANFLRLKAEFYKTSTNLENDYHQLIKQQILVSEKQDAVRELLFKSKFIMESSATTGRVFVLTFVDVLDLYERTTAIHYDYASLRDKFGATGILTDIAHAITIIADVLDNVGFSIQSNLHSKTKVNLPAQVENLRLKIEAVGKNQSENSNLALKKILINIRNLAQRTDNILTYFNQKYTGQEANTSQLEYSRFVSHQDLDPKKFRDNLSFASVTFKHALRVALVSLVGFILTKLLPYGAHSYWILLTIIVILKPGFSLTKQRNMQRIIGTLTGSTLGFLLLAFITDTRALFILLLLFMIGTYSFQRLSYVVSVIFMTPFVLILFKFLDVGGTGLVQERVLDTLIGSGLAFTASYLLFPSWEAEQLKDYLRDVLLANSKYLQKLTEGLAGKTVLVPDYRLVRKEVYVSAANLSAAFQRMISEPKSKQKNRKEIHKFIVLNHMLSAYIATIAAAMQSKDQVLPEVVSWRPLRRALVYLQDGIEKLDPTYTAPIPENLLNEVEISEKPEPDEDARLLQEQLSFIQKVSQDISRIVDSILSNSF